MSHQPENKVTRIVPVGTSKIMMPEGSGAWVARQIAEMDQATEAPIQAIEHKPTDRAR